MKYFLLTILIATYSLRVNSQIIEFVGKNKNNITDTVIFGFDNRATTSIDIDLGEVDISNSQPDSLELRIIHRDTNNFNCLYDTSDQPIYYPNNIELKRDFRPKLLGNEFSYFEIKNVTNNFTSGYIINLKRYHTISKRSYYLGFRPVSNCNKLNYIYFNLLSGNDSIFLYSIVVTDKDPQYPDSTYKYFNFHLKHNDEISDVKNTLLNKALIYPNPTSDLIVINSNETIRIHDQSGSLIIQLEATVDRHVVDLSLLPQGIYLVSVINKKGALLMNSKIIKN